MSAPVEIEDEENAWPVDEAREPPEAAKSRRPWSARLSRNLDDDDLRHPGVHRMILGELDRLDEANAELKSQLAQLGSCATELAVAKVTIESLGRGDILVNGSFTLCGLLLGYTPNLASPQSYVVGAFGVIAFVVAVGARWRRK